MGAERLPAVDRPTSDELLDIVGAVKAEAAERPMYAGLIFGRRDNVQGAVLHVHLRGKTGVIDTTFVVTRSKRAGMGAVDPKELVRRCMVWLRQRERSAVIVSPSLAVRPPAEAA